MIPGVPDDERQGKVAWMPFPEQSGTPENPACHIQLTVEIRQLLTSMVVREEKTLVGQAGAPTTSGIYKHSRQVAESPY